MKDSLRHDANAGDPYACLAVAYFLQTGKEMAQDIPKAVRWYEKAAEGGCPRAHWELAQMYLGGEYVVRDVSHYIEHLTKAAELGNADAQQTLGEEYGQGFILHRDYETSYAWYSKAAAQGSSKAKFALGYMLKHGMGVMRNDSEAETWFSSASMSGDAEMFLGIGMGYEFGLHGMERDYSEAARWYRYGTEMGHDGCIISWNSLTDGIRDGSMDTLEVRMHKIYSVGSRKELAARENALATADEFFESGDEEGALEYYERAAELGSHEAMFAIAMMHHQGIAVRRDDARAIQLLSRAANAGSEDAQFYLARAYESGLIPKDDSQIVKLYADAAFNGFLAAFYYLGKYVDHPEVYVRRTHTRR